MACSRVPGCEDVCVYAEPLFSIHASSHLKLSLIEPTYDWLATLPTQGVKREINLMTMERARSASTRKFVKCAGEKFFAAGIYEKGDCLPNVETVSGNVPVLVIDPVQWNVEFRCFVVDRKIVASSPYLVDGELAKNTEDQWVACDEDAADMAAFAQVFLEDRSVKLPPAVVVDIGRIKERGWAVVEANPAWGSGLYGCDPADALEAVRRSCVKTNLLSQSDRHWVIDHASENFL